MTPLFGTFFIIFGIYVVTGNVSSFLNDIDKKLCKKLSNNANVYFNDTITSNKIKCVLDGSGYDELRPLYDVRFNERPTFIFECFTYNDVKIVFDYAFKNDIKFRIRSGGHNIAGYSICNNCFSIDVRRLRDIEIDEAIPSGICILCYLIRCVIFEFIFVFSSFRSWMECCSTFISIRNGYLNQILVTIWIKQCWSRWSYSRSV